MRRLLFGGKKSTASHPLEKGDLCLALPPPAFNAADSSLHLATVVSFAKKRVVFRRLTAKSVSAIKKAAHLLQDVEYDAVIDDAESERNPSPMAARAGASGRAQPAGPSRAVPRAAR